MGESKGVGILFFGIPKKAAKNIPKTVGDAFIYTDGVEYTMKERYFIIWDCKCETRNMSNHYGYELPTKKKLRYFCRSCESFLRMDSNNVDVKLITMSIKRATVVMLDE